MQTAAPPSRRLPRWIGAAVLAAAAAYLAWVLSRQWDSTALVLRAYPWPYLAGAVGAALVMMGLKACYQVLLLRASAVPAAPFKLATAYALGQIVRYLPGKVLGLLYQAHHLGGTAAIPAVFVVNLVQFAHTVFVVVGMGAATAAAAFVSVPAAVLVLAATLAALFFSHRHALTERLLRALALRLPLLRRVLDAGPPATRSNGFSLLVSLLLMAEWLPFVASWLLLLPAGAREPAAAMTAAVCYSLASLAAALAVVVPSGILLREALFVWLGTRLTADAGQLLVLGLVARFVYTCADLLFAALFLGLDTLHARRR